MKIITTIVLALSFINSGYAADAKDDSAKKAEMMKMMQEYGTPGPEHKVLEDMAGKYSYTMKMWESADSKPMESKGTATMKMILGGRYLQQEIKGTAMGGPFEGVGTFGYDKVKKQYISSWIDNMGTAMATGTGSFDDATKTLTDHGTFSCPMTKSKTNTYRDEWKMVSKNNMVYSMFGTHGTEGEKEFKMMEMDFKKK